MSLSGRVKVLFAVLLLAMSIGPGSAARPILWSAPPDPLGRKWKAVAANNLGEWTSANDRVWDAKEAARHVARPLCENQFNRDCPITLAMPDPKLLLILSAALMKK
jgi:hypothetical protein